MQLLQVHQEVNSKVNLKKEFGIEKYWLKLPEQKRIWISKLITCNLGIPIETERWNNIPRQESIYTFCNGTNSLATNLIYF